MTTSDFTRNTKLSEDYGKRAIADWDLQLAETSPDWTDALAVQRPTVCAPSRHALIMARYRERMAAEARELSSQAYIERLAWI